MSAHSIIIILALLSFVLFIGLMGYREKYLILLDAMGSEEE